VAGHAAILPDDPAPTHPIDGLYFAASAGLGGLVGWATARGHKSVLLYRADTTTAAAELNDADLERGRNLVRAALVHRVQEKQLEGSTGSRLSPE